MLRRMQETRNILEFLEQLVIELLTDFKELVKNVPATLEDR